MKAGGTCNGPPGVRKEYHRYYYGAFITDLDGHNVECVCHWPPILLWMVSWPAIVGYIGRQFGLKGANCRDYYGWSVAIFWMVLRTGISICNERRINSIQISILKGYDYCEMKFPANHSSIQSFPLKF